MTNKYLVFIHSFFCLHVLISGQGAPGGVGDLDADAQAKFDSLQAKAQSQGAGESGIAVFEPFPCKLFTDALVQSSAGRTVGSCETNTCDGCCRYHTAFLTCDTGNIYPQLTCVCNDRTIDVRAVDDGGGSAGGGVDTGGGGSTGGGSTVSVPPPSPSPLPAFPTADVQQGNPTETDPASCANGSIWQQTNTLNFQNCASSADCNDILIKGVQTCCKRAFCWCGEFDISEVECVA
jgi:hypothetical protein